MRRAGLFTWRLIPYWRRLLLNMLWELSKWRRKVNPAWAQKIRINRAGRDRIPTFASFFMAPLNHNDCEWLWLYLTFKTTRYNLLVTLHLNRLFVSFSISTSKARTFETDESWKSMRAQSYTFCQMMTFPIYSKKPPPISWYAIPNCLIYWR